MKVVSQKMELPSETQIGSARHIVDVASEASSFFVMASRLVGDRVETQWQTARFPTRDLTRAVADLVNTLVDAHAELSLDDFISAIQDGGGQSADDR